MALMPSINVEEKPGKTNEIPKINIPNSMMANLIKK